MLRGMELPTLDRLSIGMDLPAGLGGGDYLDFIPHIEPRDGTVLYHCRVGYSIKVGAHRKGEPTIPRLVFSTDEGDVVHTANFVERGEDEGTNEVTGGGYVINAKRINFRDKPYGYLTVAVFLDGSEIGTRRFQCGDLNDGPARPRE